ncbi:hypothetical protein [Cupriavidus campinensis]|uniref:Glycosyltransferase family 4 protein n=1 Tax=Cupriavidus campinensis TaxID=151783 RepID=A0AAE9HX22_9BURK|nr:hypothetical protein [Cupriavidus campinensis]URF03423.1 hypothetical protein M5D45_12910 [Cupriavidus campinensis]
MTKRLTVGWKVTSLSNRIASIRYRALFPLLALRGSDVESHVFAAGTSDQLDGLDVLVIVKAFSVQDVALAHTAAQRGIPVIFDLCDNIFVDSYNRNGSLSPAPVLQGLAGLLSAVVVTTQPLADAVCVHLGSDVPVFVVPDGIEQPALIADAASAMEEAKRRVRAQPLFRRLRYSPKVLNGLALMRSGKVHVLTGRMVRKVARSAPVRRAVRTTLQPLKPSWWYKRAYFVFETARARVQGRPSRVARKPEPAAVEYPVAGNTPAAPDARRLLWFGNHGAVHGRFGMVDLVDIQADLERVAAECHVELVVVSNSVKKYAELIHPIRIPSRYVEWSSEAVQQELSRAAVVLVPNSRDPFSICKSANRTVLALQANVPVVATYTPALEPLRRCIRTEGFYEGIVAYLKDPALGAAQAAQGQAIANALFGQPAIGERWLEVLTRVRTQPPARQAATPELLVVANLVQDVELIAPLVDAARARQIETAVWASTSMARRWPYALTALHGLGVPVRLINDEPHAMANVEIPSSVRALLTIAETSLGPHRFAHQLTRRACKTGVTTATLQHGYENVGLTYTDEVHCIDRIEFAASRIFTWGTLDQLHPGIRNDNRAKCVAAGTPKPVAGNPRPLPSSVPDDKPLIGVFENLHWHRYSEAYRAFFLESVEKIARAFPDVTFLVKPHNAGRWLTSRHKGDKPVAPNLLVADPSDVQWEGVTANDLLGHMQGVITSPSTVALDAARAGLPSAVVGFDLPLDNYAPLPTIIAIDDWLSFVGACLDESDRAQLVASSRQFVERVIVPGDAAARIIETLFEKAERPMVEKT